MRLVRLRVLARLERRVGGLGRGSSSWTYALDTVGQRLASGGPGRRPHLPRPAFWTHALMVSEVYTRLVEGLRRSQASLGDWQGEPRSWRRFSGPYAEPVVIKPDACLRVAGPDYDDLFFLEIDTGSQSTTVLRAKLDLYRRYAATGQEQAAEGVFPRVVFLTSGPRRLQQIVDVIGTQPAEYWHLFSAGLIAETDRLLLGEPGEATSP